MSFVLVTARDETREAKMTIPADRFLEGLAAFAAEMPDSLAWSAKPCGSIDVRAAEAQ